MGTLPGKPGQASSPAGGAGTLPARSRPLAGPRLAWAAWGIALVAVLAAAYWMSEARRSGLDSSALAQRIEAVEAQVSEIRAADPSAAIADAEARIAELAESMAGLEASMVERLDSLQEEVAGLGGREEAGAAALDAELLARLDLLEKALGETKARQPEAENAGRDEQAGDSTPWWSVFGKMLKISKVEEE